jgi:hypothetical protein
MKVGKTMSVKYMANGANSSHKKLDTIISNIKTTGITALGPAALVSVAMAGELGNGSSVVICTDGLSNLGLGNLASLKKGKATQEEVDNFYEKLAEYANGKGVSISLFSVQGEECDLETLMTLSDKTGGDADILDPKEAEKHLKRAFKRKKIATKVTLKVLLHKALEFKNENEAYLNKDKNLMTRNLGAVYMDTEVAFAYKMKDPEKLEKMKDFNIDDFYQVPFQCSIEYTTLDGKK